MLEFDLLTKELQDSGYTVIIESMGVYRFARVSGIGIIGGYCEPTDGKCYPYIDGNFAADNAETFNKWSQCPLIVKLPKTTKEAATIVEHLKWLGTAEGGEWSDAFGYLNDARLPNLFVRLDK
jgi:hypothetical protein